MAIRRLPRNGANPRRMLEAERARLIAGEAMLAARENGLGETKARVLGGEDADVASDLFEQEMADGLRRTMRAKIIDIELALGRLQSGRYGKCEDCSGEIDPARLEALPRACRCLPCQRRAEALGAGRRAA